METQNDQNAAGESASGSHDRHGRRGFILSAAATAGAILGPHALCALGLTGVGVGSVAFWNSCHSTSDADSSRGIELARPTAVPENYVLFDEQRSARAKDALLKAEPRFAEIIQAKRREAPGEDIEIVFIEDKTDGHVNVVVCKDGALCPCSKPQVYDLGHQHDVTGYEAFHGQFEVLRALYQEH